MPHVFAEVLNERIEIAAVCNTLPHAVHRESVAESVTGRLFTGFAIERGFGMDFVKYPAY